jgi:pimeloyl-ACP methyl ester carboxylesterase
MTGRVAMITAFLPGGLYLSANLLRMKALRRMPFTFGWMTKRPIPDEMFDRWMRPGRSQAGVRRDLTKYARGAYGYRRELRNATEQLNTFNRPALVVWASEDRVMPREHGRRMAELLPRCRLVEIADSYTLIPLDQPMKLAGLVREFVASQAGELS